MQLNLGSCYLVFFSFMWVTKALKNLIKFNKRRKETFFYFLGRCMSQCPRPEILFSPCSLLQRQEFDKFEGNLTWIIEDHINKTVLLSGCLLMNLPSNSEKLRSVWVCFSTYLLLQLHSIFNLKKNSFTQSSSLWISNAKVEGRSSFLFHFKSLESLFLKDLDEQAETNSRNG